jgi:bifunctional UDP-N-acetylglucosamine pyrophosphorylase/glucosamine-1-phosphate N-acetyltransferase
VSRLGRAYDKHNASIALVSFCPDDPTGYGRIIRENGAPVAIREHRDCDKYEKQIREVNAGIYLIDIGFLRRSVKKLSTDNDQGELYLTDLVEMAAAKKRVAAVEVPARVVSGVNDRADLAALERLLREERNLKLMRSGVTLRQPETVHVELDVKVAKDVEIRPGAHLIGRTSVGRGAVIGAGAVIVDSDIGPGAIIKPYSVIEQATVRSGAEIGPMARLRPGADIGVGAKVGNWVEVKNTVMGEGAKANHLAYLGDGDIGARVNVGAGTIFCNYDGFLKHRTVLGDDVFIGSDSQLVAPVTVGDGAYVASGSTITMDVPADDLAISRVKQVNRRGTAKKLRERLKAKKEAAKSAKDKR